MSKCQWTIATIDWTPFALLKRLRVNIGPNMITSTKSVSSIYRLIQNHPSIPKVLLSLQLQNPQVPTSPVLLVDARNITGLSLRLRPTCATVTAVPVMASAMAVTLGRGKEGLEAVCPPWLINVGLAEGASIMAARAGKLWSMLGSTCLDSPWRMEKPFGNKGNI